MNSFALWNIHFTIFYVVFQHLFFSCLHSFRGCLAARSRRACLLPSVPVCFSPRCFPSCAASLPPTADVPFLYTGFVIFPTIYSPSIAGWPHLLCWNAVIGSFLAALFFPPSDRSRAFLSLILDCACESSRLRCDLLCSN